MGLDSSQRVLFGQEFPRAVGVTTPEGKNSLRQYIVNSKTELELVLDRVSGERNLYCSISAYIPITTDEGYEGNAVSIDKVSFDLDSSAKADPNMAIKWSDPSIPDYASDTQVAGMMNDDPDILHAVLGDVCDDAREMANECISSNIPLVGVFSGFGIHMHQLYSETKRRPNDKMISTYNQWVDTMDLKCIDERASGKPFRIMRFPNVERVCHDGVGTSYPETEPLGLFTVPIRRRELADITPEDLMGMSPHPRRIDGIEPPSRPEISVQEGYLGPMNPNGSDQSDMRDVPDECVTDSFAKELVKDITKMPCVYERAFGSNPPNDVRVKMGIMFLNAGFSPSEATEIFARLDWVDFDRDITQYQLEKLQYSGKGDWSCNTMQTKGLCTRADNKTDCETYGYIGGNTPNA